MRIVNTYPLPSDAVARLAALPGVTVSSAQADLHDVVRSAVEVLFGELPDDGPASMPHLRWLARAGAGIEDLDLSGLAARGIVLTNASGLHASAMGEYCLGALLFASQHQAVRLARQAAHEWDSAAAFAEPLRGRTLGVIGYGSIGREVARLAAAFGMRVLAIKAQPGDRRDPGFRPAGTGDPDGTIPERIDGPSGLLGVLAESDYIVLSMPLTRATHGLIDRDALAACRPTAWLVNVGRGPMIVEAALIEALRSGRLGGAYLDVFDEEPLPVDHPYWDTPNLFISPHIAGVNSYDVYWQQLGELLVENLRRLLADEPMLNQIDLARAY
jgi:phosphoglycerate dehydrogenase-like enzyme